MDELKVCGNVIPCAVDIEGVQDKLDSLVLLARVLGYEVYYFKTNRSYDTWLSITKNKSMTFDNGFAIAIDFFADENGLYTLGCYQGINTPFVSDDAEGMIDGIDKLIDLL